MSYHQPGHSADPSPQEWDLHKPSTVLPRIAFVYLILPPKILGLLLSIRRSPIKTGFDQRENHLGLKTQPWSQ